MNRKQIVSNLIYDDLYKPMKEKELAFFLGVQQEQREELRNILEELIEEGKIIRTKRGLLKPVKDQYITGIFQGTRKGFGFVMPEDGSEEIFVSASDTKDAFHKDKVVIKITKLPSRYGNQKREGEVVRVLERGMKKLVGVFQRQKNFGFVVPDEGKFYADIFIPKKNAKGVSNGQKVVVEIEDYGDGYRESPTGNILEVLGDINDPRSDFGSVVNQYELRQEFSDDIYKEIGKISRVVSEFEKENRSDFTNILTITIDGEDAKDLDDAISLKRTDYGWQLGVHIADVSHYVRENSALDKEAIGRGTSVYLINRVIPMLPKELSNGICSLNEGVDRLTLSCIMDVDKNGRVMEHEIVESVICSNRRMTYTSVQKILDGDDKERAKYSELVEMIEEMKNLSVVLRKKRREKGSIDFDFPESKIILDERDAPIEIKAYDRNDATRLIEDFMLLANETVAEDYYWQGIPFVYRVHETPDKDRMEKFSVLIQNFGYHIKIGREKMHPKEIQKLLGKIEGTPEEPLISRLALRSMKQARYTTQNSGHFGLSMQYYCHFTSPIRRYPDLQIHRIIKENLKYGIEGKRRAHYDAILDKIAMQSSQRERIAEQAERDLRKLKKIEYVQEHLQERYEGVISGMTEHAIYVELPNTIEGMIPLEFMADYFEYDERNCCMKGEFTGKIYRLGQKVKVELFSASKQERTIQFLMIS